MIIINVSIIGININSIATIDSLSYIIITSVAMTVGFHHVNLRILNLRVSNPNKLIVVVF